MKSSLPVLLIALCFGCREQPPAEPGDQPVEKPVTTAGKPQSSGTGGAIVDVITQRNKIEMGKEAKARIQEAAARENRDIEEVLRD